MPDPAPTNPPPPADLTGRTIGDFHILRHLGAGGMGHVYLARQLSLKREVAVKFLRHELATNANALKRFEAEAHAVARLNHPNIVQVYAVGEHEGLRFMALEYVEGRNLRDYLDRRGSPDLAVSLSVMRQVAFALQRAHEEGIVHRDIKPENILVTRRVGVKVTDFGLSRVFAGDGERIHLTQSGMTLGTPLYLSPEQAQGHAVDHRSDIYSLGVTCYHLLAGEPPFRGSTAVEVALKHVTDPPRPLAQLRPDLPADLAALVHKMMAKRADERYQSAREVLRDLAKVRGGLAIGVTQPMNLASSLALPAAGVLTLSTSEVMPAPRPVRWGRWLLAGLAVLLAAAGGVAGYLLLNPPAETAPPPPSNPPQVGLPDVRPPERLNTARERELLAVLASEEPKSEEVIAASVELGLLYVREKRLDDAEARFKKLEAKQFPKEFVATGTANLAGRLGQAIVLAYRDRVTESNRLFTEVVNSPFGKVNPKKDKDVPAVVPTMLLRYPDLGQSAADALARNAANLAPAKLPAQLEALRTPRVGPK